MVTINLWRALQHPYERHPTFRFVQAGKYQRHNLYPPNNRLAWPTFGFDGITGKIFGILAILMFLCAGGWMFLIPLVFILPLLLFITGTINGLAIALGVSGHIAREHQLGRESVMAVTPSGLPGMNWAICTAIYHRNTVLGQFRFTVGSIYQAIYIGLIVLTTILGINWSLHIIREQTLIAADETLVNTIILLLTMIAFHADYVQSILMGTIIGMLVPTYARNQVDARAFSMGAFLALQMLIYAISGLISFLLIPMIFAHANLENSLALSLCRLIIFVGARESILTFLWHQLANRLDLDHLELLSLAVNTQT